MTLSGNPLASVEMQVSTGGSVTTDASGNYSFSQNYGWSGTVTPGLVGYTFTPANRTYAAVQADTPGQDYDGHAQHLYDQRDGDGWCESRSRSGTHRSSGRPDDRRLRQLFGDGRLRLGRDGDADAGRVHVHTLNEGLFGRRH